jgi:hypothetical protein
MFEPPVTAAPSSKRNPCAPAAPGLQRQNPKQLVPDTAFDALAGRPIGAFRGHVGKLFSSWWTGANAHNYSGAGLPRIASEEWR